MNQITTIIFDFGNVVAFFDHMKACKGFAEFSPYSAEKIYELIFGAGIEQKFDEGRITPEEFFQEVVKTISLDKIVNFKNFQKIWADIFWSNPKMQKVITDLKNKGYKLVLLSNTNETHFNWFYQKIKILSMFAQFVLSFKSHEYRKPDSRMWQGFGKESIYIDDKFEYCEIAEKAGIAKSFLYDAKNHEEFVKELFAYLKGG